MNKVIILPGKMDSVFFINEIDYITKNFDEVLVISYPGEESVFSKIAKEKGFRYVVVKTNLYKVLFDVDFYKWLFDTNTKTEIKSAFSISKKGFSKLIYILYYGLFYIHTKKFIDYEIGKCPSDNVYLYSFWLSRGAYTIANYNINRKSNVMKLLSRAHGYDLYEERNSMNYLPFREFINENIDEIHFISENGMKYFTNKFDKNSISSRKYISRLGTYNPNSFHKEVKFKKKICIASCSSTISVKRLDLIIDVIANINISVEWIHIGIGNLQNSMKSYAEEKLFGKAYHFLGEMENSAILKTYNEYDVDFFINMSDSEGVPVSIMEAMSAGIPTIARNVGGNKEIVNMNTGLLIEDTSNMELVYSLVNEEIRTRICDTNIYQLKSIECIKLWDEKYNAYKNYNKFFTKFVSS
jgi:glycosyltransferase involved in cell wall biosynthesis